MTLKGNCSDRQTRIPQKPASIANSSRPHKANLASNSTRNTGGLRRSTSCSSICACRQDGTDFVRCGRSGPSIQISSLRFAPLTQTIRTARSFRRSETSRAFSYSRSRFIQRRSCKWSALRCTRTESTVSSTVSLHTKSFRGDRRGGPVNAVPADRPLAVW